MPAPHHPASRYPAWRTSAVTHGPACLPTAAARLPQCSPWTAYPTSTSLLISPRGRWSLGWLAWPTTVLLSLVKGCSSTRPQWPISLWSGNAGLRLASSLQAASNPQSSCTLTACPGPCPHTSITQYTALAWCQSGARIAKGRPLPEREVGGAGERDRRGEREMRDSSDTNPVDEKLISSVLTSVPEAPIAADQISGLKPFIPKIVTLSF